MPKKIKSNDMTVNKSYLPNSNSHNEQLISNEGGNIKMKFNNTVQILSESYQIKEDFDPITKKVTGVKLSGKAITPDKPTRNKVSYTKDSLMRTHKSLIGKPFLDSHNDNNIRNNPPFGHVTNSIMQDDGLYYEVDLDPAEQTFIRKAKRGDIAGVSIQVLVEDVEQENGFIRANIQEFLELSAVLIPGDGDTSMKISEMFKGNSLTEDDLKKCSESVEKPIKLKEEPDDRPPKVWWDK